MYINVKYITLGKRRHMNDDASAQQVYGDI